MIPIEWLNDLLRERDGFRRLLDETEGNLATAAYRLALAQCMTRELSTHVPTRGEVRAAAKLIASRVGSEPAPRSATLLADLEAAGLPVL